MFDEKIRLIGLLKVVDTINSACVFKAFLTLGKKYLKIVQF